jgi:diketogulonate reductase-like aldo/keto reductase
MEYFELNDGNKIPAIGFGLFMIPADGPTYGRRSPRWRLATATSTRRPPT